ncbi:predicted protein [Lichtheimia corymbifera JMRC:FSU:9682]|uniref:Uncharacterized protein n=1 Tax=Lichtheimia corymbifera JMRC:FSU:9682 TaxID=1263082 RepID=A0A068RJL5_9FUNG|nr:predicted protein [Lichtheimia corymbifera JMRC:FSU:9682]
MRSRHGSTFFKETLILTRSIHLGNYHHTSWGFFQQKQPGDDSSNDNELKDNKKLQVLYLGYLAYYLECTGCPHGKRKQMCRPHFMPTWNGEGQMRPMQVLPHCELLKGEGKGVQCNGCEHGKLNGRICPMQRIPS